MIVFFYAETKPGIVQLLGDQTKPKAHFMRFTPGMHGLITHQSVFSYSLNQIATEINSQHFFQWIDQNTTQLKCIPHKVQFDGLSSEL